MKMMAFVLPVGLAISASAVAGGDAWPFVTVRLAGSADIHGEKMAELAEVNARHPGSCDEFWLALGAVADGETIERRMTLTEGQRTACAKAGITIGFQQGETLGHGEIGSAAGCGGSTVDGLSRDGSHWQVGRDGQALKMLCPRSPDVLRYEADYAERVVRSSGTRSFWLDDDLRLGFHKADGCFCDRCLADFNRTNGLSLSRSELCERLFGTEKKDAVRRAWLKFNADSLALFGAAARRGIDRVDPTVRIAVQTVASSSLHSGRDYLQLLRALSDGGRHATGVRAGSGCYFEHPFDIVDKALEVAREAERCRTCGALVGTVCYEQESYTREVLHKSPEAVMIESAVALAAGCDTLSEYWWSVHRPEPLSYYEEFAAEIAAWRPYLRRLADLAGTTHLGGVARFVGSEADLLARRSLADPVDAQWARMGVPVTVADARQGVFYADSVTADELGDGDFAALAAKGCLVDAAVAKGLATRFGAAFASAAKDGRIRAFDFSKTLQRSVTLPTVEERKALLDALDALSPMPVRLDRAHRVALYPRVDRDGCTVAVTLFNLSMGRMPSTELRVRRPVGAAASWASPRQNDVPLTVRADGDELHVRLPPLLGCAVATVFLR